MHKEQLSLLVEEGHPAYEWAKKQSDSVSAFGHIGTHIDCYGPEPDKAKYEVETVVLDLSLDHISNSFAILNPSARS